MNKGYALNSKIKMGIFPDFLAIFCNFIFENYVLITVADK